MPTVDPPQTPAEAKAALKAERRRARRKKPRSKAKDYAQYLTLRLLSCAMTCFPVRWNLAFADQLGNLMHAFDRKHRERGLDNLRQSFPDRPIGELADVNKRSMRQMIALFVEVLFTTRVVRLETIRQRIELRDFGRTLRLLLDEDRGLIMLTGHYGNWEGMGYAAGLLGFDTTSVARPLDNPYINRFLLGVREEHGQRILDKKGATPVVTSALEEHGTVGMIADQDAGKKGTFVPFFGREASTYKSIALLAMQYEVPIAVGYARRYPGAYRMTVGVQDVILPEDWAKERDPVRYITERYTKAIEAFVRDDPSQYLWVHRRWKTRPRHELRALERRRQQEEDPSKAPEETNAA